MDNVFTRGLNLILAEDAYVVVLDVVGTLTLTEAKQKLGRGARTQGPYEGYVSICHQQAAGFATTVQSILERNERCIWSPFHNVLCRAMMDVFDNPPKVGNSKMRVLPFNCYPNLNPVLEKWLELSSAAV